MQERLADARVATEPAEVVRAQSKVNLRTGVDVVSEDARFAHAHLTLGRHLGEEAHAKLVLGHDAEDTGVAREFVEHAEGRGGGGADRVGDGK